MQNFHRAILISALLGAAWVATVAYGMRLLSAQPGATQPARFPHGAALYLAKDKPTLVVLAEPGSSRAAATIGKLGPALAGCEGKLKTYVLLAPRAAGALHENERELWENAAALRDVIPVRDEDGAEARRFSSRNGAEALLYASDGRLLFSGDISSTLTASLR